MVFVVMVVVIIAFIALWNFDLHKLIFVKTISLNASDAAALAGARWQGITLNLLGDLNIAEAVSINDALLRGETNDFPEAQAIAELAMRARYAGPMIGYAVAQQAAKNNRTYAYADFTTRVHGQAQAIRGSVKTHDLAGLIQLDYADMLDSVANDGIAALASDFEPNILRDKAFYNAILAPDWCWFKNNYLNLLGGNLLYQYHSYEQWQRPVPLDPLSVNVTAITNLAELSGWMGDPTTPLKALHQMSQSSVLPLSNKLIPITITNFVWFCYDYTWQQKWSQYLKDNRDGSPFPFASDIRQEYDIRGAANVMRVSADPPPAYFNKTSHHITSVSAARPFGYLTGPLPASQYGLVLPAFHDARLIPVDSSGLQPPADADDPEFERHIDTEVWIYLDHGGPPAITAFKDRYCSALVLWEQDSFRKIGRDWLENPTNHCPQPNPHGGGGGGGGGGSAHGH